MADTRTPEQKKIDSFKKAKELSNNEYKKYSANWDFYEATYLGARFDVLPATVKEYSSNNIPLVIFKDTNSGRKDEMPDRIQNHLFGQIQSELALYSRTEPTVRVVPKSMDVRDKANRLNLFNDQVFLDKLPDEVTFMQQNVLLFGHGFLQTFVKKNVGDHKIPFSILWESSRNIKFDPNADRWEDVKWVIKTIKKYYFEVKAKYPNIEEFAQKDDYDVIEIEEFWEKNHEDGKWERSVIYADNNLLKTDGKDAEIDYRYPDVPIQIFKIYRKEKGCAGISQVQLQLDDQLTINKRASMLDYKISYDIDPAVEINEGMISAEALAEFQNLYPGKKVPVQQNGAIKPIVTQLINNSELYSSIGVLDENMRDISGLAKVLEGGNEKGTYSFKQFNAIRESANVRIDMKLEWYTKAVVELAKKVYKYAVDYLGDSDYFEVYDYENKKTVRLTAKDFDLEDLDLIVEVQDANLLHPGEKLKTLLEMVQYMPDIDRRFIVLAIDKASHGIIPSEMLKRIEASFEEEKKQKKNQNNILNTAQIPAQVQQTPPNPQMPTPPPAPPAPEQGEPAQVTQARQMLTQAGLPPEQIDQLFQQVMGQIPPDTPPEQQGQVFIMILSQLLSKGGM